MWPLTVTMKCFAFVLRHVTIPVAVNIAVATAANAAASSLPLIEFFSFSCPTTVHVALDPRGADVLDGGVGQAGARGSGGAHGSPLMVGVGIFRSTTERGSETCTSSEHDPCLMRSEVPPSIAVHAACCRPFSCSLSFWSTRSALMTKDTRRWNSSRGEVAHMKGQGHLPSSGIGARGYRTCFPGHAPKLCLPSSFRLSSLSLFDPTVSLQSLVPTGRLVAQVLLGYVAFRLGQHTSAVETEGEHSTLASPARSSIEAPATSTATARGKSDVGTVVQPLWNNMVQLAFVAANLVSANVSMTMCGLLQGGLVVPGDQSVARDDWIHASALDARRASAAAATFPIFHGSSLDVHASVALAARVLGMFPPLSRGPCVDLYALCTCRSVIPDQGALMWPLLRFSLFLLVRLHPCTKSGQENVWRFESLVKTLLDPAFQAYLDQPLADGDDMCMVIVVHVHAALLRFKAQVSGMLSFPPPEMPGDGSGDGSGNGSVGQGVTSSKSTKPLAEVSEASAYHVGNSLFGLLLCFTRRRRDLLRARLGEDITNLLVEGVEAEAESRSPRSPQESGDASRQAGMPVEEPSWDSIARSLDWMEKIPLFKYTSGEGIGVSSLFKACVPSLKVLVGFP